MTRATSAAESDSELLLGALAEEFTARRRAGEQPSVDEYAARHPEHAEAIRAVLGTVDALEATGVGALDAGPASMPARIGEYRIDRELGRGGMGVVFLATDVELGRRVALKLLPVQATLDRRFLERFRREARSAAGLHHPNIVPVYGVGEEQGLHYYAMQYVEGHPLDEIVRTLQATRDERDAARDGGGEGEGAERVDSALALARELVQRDLSDASDPSTRGATTSGDSTVPPATRAGTGAVPADVESIGARGTSYHRNVARLGLRVARALAYAHARGILHRDVKPGNLLLGEHGQVWITDFGLCTSTAGEGSRLTSPMELVGTLRYMAPEQIEGTADVRSDVYGLGTTLYELLTLRPAFAARDRAALVEQVVAHTPLRPRRIDARIPADLEAIVSKATAKLPDERYGTADALADDLAAFLEGRPVAARRPGVLHLLRLAVRRNRLLTATIASALAILVVATVFYLRSLQRARAETVRQLYLANVSAASAAVDVDARAATAALAAAPSAHRGWEWRHLVARADQSIATIARLDARVGALEVTPDGRALVATAGGRLAVVDLSAPDAPRFSEELGESLTFLALDRDGRRAAVVAGADVFVLDLEGPSVVARRRVDALARGLDFDARGERLYVALRSGVIVVYDPLLERELGRLRGHAGAIDDIVALADGRFATAGDDGTVRIVELDGKGVRVLSGHAAGVRSLAAGPSAELLGSLALDGEVRLWHVAAGASIAAWPGPALGTGLGALAFSRDGRYLVSGCDDRTLRVWDAIDARDAFELPSSSEGLPPLREWVPPWRDRAVRVLLGNGAFVTGLAFGRDGRLYSSNYDGVLFAWDVEADGGRIILSGHLSDCWGLAFDRGGERIASTSRDATVRIWNASTGAELVRIPSGSVPYGVAFAPDGNQVAVVCRDGVLRIFDARSGARVAELRCSESGVVEALQGRVGFAPDGERLFVTEHGLGVDVWRRSAGAREGWALEQHVPVRGAYTSEPAPDGGGVAVGTVDGRVVVVDTSTWSPRFSADAHEGRIRSLAFRADARRLATAGPDGLAKVWDARTGELCATLPVRAASAYEGDIEGVAYSPDGARLACVLTASGVALWDPEACELVVTLAGPGSGYNQVAFDPTGEKLASGSWRGEIRVWDTMAARERSALLELDGGGSAEPRERVLRAGFASLLERARGLLRAETLDPAAVHEAHWIARGLQKGYPRDPRTNEIFGEGLYRDGLAEVACTFLETAVEGDPVIGATTRFDALVFLAMARASLGSLEVAESALARAEEIVDEAPVHGPRGPRELLAEAKGVISNARQRADR